MRTSAAIAVATLSAAFAFSREVETDDTSRPVTHAARPMTPPAKPAPEATTPCAAAQQGIGPITADLFTTCRGDRTTRPPVLFTPAAVQGPILLAESETYSVNATSISGIGTLSPFAVVRPPSDTDFPADLALLRDDPAHVYQLSSRGLVTVYDTMGASAVIAMIPTPPGSMWTDMATDPTTGLVYAVAAAESFLGQASLHVLDLRQGTSRPVGPILRARGLVGLAFDPKGNLYATDVVYDALVAIDKTNAVGKFVGLLGFDANFGQSMDWDPWTYSMYLFAFNNASFRPELRKVDLETGATRLVGAIGSRTPSGNLQVPAAVFGTIASRTSPNACPGGVLYSETFGSSLGSTTATNVCSTGASWHFRNNCNSSGLSGHSAPGHARWGSSSSCGNYGSTYTQDYLETPVVNVSSCSGTVKLSFNYLVQFQESATYDRARVLVRVNGGAWTVIADNGSDSPYGYSCQSPGNASLSNLATSSGWQPFSVNVSASSTLQVRFVGDTEDGIWNSGEGFYVDDIEIGCPGGIVVAPGSPLLDGKVGDPYSVILTASGGTSPYTFAVTSGTLPPGIDLWDFTQDNQAELSGTPTTKGTYTFAITATDNAGCKGTTTYSLTIKEAGLGPLHLRQWDLDINKNLIGITSVPGIDVLSLMNNFFGDPPPKEVAADVEMLPGDREHLYQLSSGGETGTFDVNGFYIKLANATPPGQTWTDMAVDPTSGTVYACTKDATCASTGASTLYTINLLTGSSTLVGTIGTGRCIEGLACTTGGNLYGLSENTDQLLSISKSTGAGILVGPLGGGHNASGAQSFDCDGESPETCYAFAYDGGTDNRGELWSINLSTGAATDSPPTVIGNITPGAPVRAMGGVFGYLFACNWVTLSPQPMPDGSKGVPYSRQVTASGGTGPYNYFVNGGTIPPGLTFSSSGLMSGTPTTIPNPNPSQFTLAATDATGCTGKVLETLLIDTSPQEASPGGDMKAVKGVGTSVDVTYTPACGIVNHAIYWGTSPIAGALSWSYVACNRGTTGSANFDPGTPTAGQLFYFVIVGQTYYKEGSYGQSSTGAEEPEADGLPGGCDLPQQLGGTCP